MNKECRKRITQNLTYLKERMLDLDPLVDCLIERDVFQLEHRARIDAASPPTPQRKFNEFVQMLLSSSHPAAYHVFLEALQKERQYYVVERLQNTIVKLDTGPIMRAKTPHSNRRPQTQGSPVYDNGSGSPKGYAHIDQVASVMSKVLDEFGGKLAEELANNFEKKREEEMKALEDRMESKLNKICEKWETEKQEIVLKNENAIKFLQDSLDKLQRKNTECDKLREKYEQLKLLQKDIREKENDRWHKLTHANLENSQLKAENKKLKEEVDRLKEKVDELQDEVATVRKDKLAAEMDSKHNLTENQNLRLELEEKEKEREELKKEIENAYERVREIIRIQKEKSSTEDNSYKAVLDKQNQKLSEIYDAVHALSSRDRSNQIRVSGTPKTLYIGGNALTRINKSHK